MGVDDCRLVGEAGGVFSPPSNAARSLALFLSRGSAIVDQVETGVVEGEGAK
jgi:hypothetical protein